MNAIDEILSLTAKRNAQEPPLESYEKGVPGAIGRLPLSEVGARRWRLFAEDLPLPVAVLKISALHHNSEWMKSFAKAQNVRLAPHAKTTLCPALLDLQLHHGAWGLTVATPHQVQVARSFGYPRLFMANQLVGAGAIDWVIDELKGDPEFDFYCLIDSRENLEQLAGAARRKQLSRPLRVLVELGITGGRTGCRSVEEALALARLAAQNHDVIALRGVEGFEGLIHRPDDAQTVVEVDEFLDRVVDCARRCVQERLFAPGEVLLSAGGSAFYDRVSAKLARVDLERPTLVLLRGGCYLIHDHTMCAHAFEQMNARSSLVAGRKPGLRPALEVWGYVQSLPEPGRAIVMLGKRDISYDDVPTPVKWYRPGNDMPAAMTVDGDCRVSHLNDQHCYVNVPTDCPWRVGDMVGFGISHPCLTFDKWRVLHLVDDEYRILDSVRTYF